MLKQLDTFIGLAVVMSIVSLLVTILTQMVSALLNLRGNNLAEALRTLFYSLEPYPQDTAEMAGATQASASAKGKQPAVKDPYRALAVAVLKRPNLSDSMFSMGARFCLPRWKLASAIRPDELRDALIRLAQTPDDQRIANLAHGVLGKLQFSQSAFTNAVQAAGQEVGAEKVSNEVAAEITRLVQVAQVDVERLERGFASVLDRAQQWFAMNSRVVTVCGSLLLAFVLQLDLFQLLRQISNDQVLRAQLVAKMQANGEMDANTLTPIDLSASALHRAALQEAAKDNADFNQLATQDPGDNGATEAGMEKWIRNLVKPESVEKALQSYRTAVGKIAEDNLKTLGRNLRDASADVSSLALFPDPYPDFRQGKWSWPWDHLLGILASAGLLSLGAPFWFNLLKGLSTLRPLLAQQMDPKQGKGT